MSFEGLNNQGRQVPTARPETGRVPWKTSGSAGHMGIAQSMANNMDDPAAFAHQRLAASRRFMPQDQANAIQSSVESKYQDILGRESDPQGLAYWFNREKNGAMNQDVADVFRLSPEKLGISPEEHKLRWDVEQDLKKQNLQAELAPYQQLEEQQAYPWQQPGAQGLSYFSSPEFLKTMHEGGWDQVLAGLNGGQT